MRRRKEVAVTATFSPARRKRFGRRIYSLATIEPGSDGSHSANPERNDQTDCGESKPECDANSSLHCAPRAPFAQTRPVREEEFIPEGSTLEALEEVADQDASAVQELVYLIERSKAKKQADFNDMVHELQQTK